MGHPLVYELNTAQWLAELSARNGRAVRLGSVPPGEWDRLRDLGFTHVWLMGVWRRSPAGVRIFREGEEFGGFSPAFDHALPGWSEADLWGSPYSIAAYEPEPRLGAWDDLGGVRRALNGRGMGLVLDFVPNHTASDHPWARRHPEFYVEGREDDHARDPVAFTRLRTGGHTRYLARGRDPNYAPWTDTLQLNHFHPGARSALIGELRKIVRYCDAVRLDMAMLVLNDTFERTWGPLLGPETGRPEEEFWEAVRREMPEPVFIAEAYWGTEPRLLDTGLDYVYDKALYDALRGGDAAGVRVRLGTGVGLEHRMVRFLENHDEARAAVALPNGLHKPAAVLLATLPGMRIIHHGQMEGRRLRAPLQLACVRGEPLDGALTRLYGRSLALAREDVFGQGSWRLRQVNPAGDETHNHLVAYTWRTAGAFVLVVVNLSGSAARGLIPLGGDVAGASRWTLRDSWNGPAYERSGPEMAVAGLHVVLGGYGIHVFRLVPEGPG